MSLYDVIEALYFGREKKISTVYLFPNKNILSLLNIFAVEARLNKRIFFSSFRAKIGIENNVSISFVVLIKMIITT